MKCEACGAELKDGAANCPACGKPVTMGRRVGAETQHVAEKTGVVAEKLGRGLVGGVKGFGAGMKKGLKGSEDEKKQ
jgi:hypothetical protein